MNQYGIVVNPFTKTPTPDIGSCSKTGNWSQAGQVQECESCLEKSTSDYPYFYCDGLCSSEYDLGAGQCSLTSLVAKTKEQCKTPCYQEGSPRISGGCEDDFDCSKGQKCVSKNVVGPDGMMHKNRGVCQSKENFSLKTIWDNSCSIYKKNGIIVLIIILLIIMFFTILKLI